MIKKDFFFPFFFFFFLPMSIILTIFVYLSWSQCIVFVEKIFSICQAACWIQKLPSIWASYSFISSKLGQVRCKCNAFRCLRCLISEDLQGSSYPFTGIEKELNLPFQQWCWKRSHWLLSKAKRWKWIINTDVKKQVTNRIRPGLLVTLCHFRRTDFVRF